MTGDEYAALTQACDRLLRAPDTSLGRIAIPLLHVINEHSGWLAQYESLFRPTAVTTSWRDRYEALDMPRVTFRAARALRRSWSSKLPDLSPFRGTDVLIVSHLGNPTLLDADDDFYFGPMQQLLQNRDVRATLVLIDHRPGNTQLLDVPPRFARSRLLLPKAVAPSLEASIWRHSHAVRNQLRTSAKHAGDSLDGQVAKLASRHAMLSGTAANLRLHASLSAVCGSLNPRIVITTHEGDASERIIFHAARTASRRPLCVGYQHTRLLARAHAIGRSVAVPGIDCDPDVVLTLGETSHSLLERSPGLAGGVRAILYGSHRCPAPESSGAGKERGNRCLVLPDADDREFAFLLEFALACARRLPKMQFVVRPHPAVPIDALSKRHAALRVLPANVTLSAGKALESDLAVASCCLYRGSSAAINAVRAGIQPFYVARPGELSFDPLFALTAWRETVASADEFGAVVTENSSDEEAASDAKRQCERMMAPIRSAALDELLRL